jgi:integrase
MTKNNYYMTPKYTDEEWLERMYSKSNSYQTKLNAEVSLRIFNHFAQKQIGLNGKSKQTLIRQYQDMINQDKPDIQGICVSLDKFVGFMSIDHEDIVSAKGGIFKAKSPKTISNYFGFIKNYLRICHGIRISSEDIKDFVQFPKQRKQLREPVSLENLKKIISKATPERRALYLVLISSGMRLGEGLSLKKSSFHLDENPVRVTLRADDTKTREERETYISSEALERLKPILDSHDDDDYLFRRAQDRRIDQAVRTEVREFGYLRSRLGLTKRYHKSVRFLIHIHTFRSYFHTKASQKYGSDYANALDGHGAYLKQYYREDPKERATKYLALESDLFIEWKQLETEKTKDKIMDTMKAQMDKMQTEIQRLSMFNQAETV